MPSLTISMGTTPDTLTLQQRIDAAGAGSTLNLSIWSYTAGATVAKALTIVGGTLNVASGDGLTITASNVTVDGITIVGPQYAAYDVTQRGIYAHGASGANISGLVIQNCDISQFGCSAIWTIWTTSPSIYHNALHNLAFSGVTMQGSTGGSISTNTVQRIGYGGTTGLPGAGTNSYGICCDYSVTGTESSDVVVADNVVEDVPLWHGLDTHSGVRVQFLRNTVRRCSRGLFLTAGGPSPLNLVITDNQILSPDPVTVNLVPITLASVTGATFTGNAITGWGAATAPATNTQPWYDYQGLSTGLVDGGGNVVTP